MKTERAVPLTERERWIKKVIYLSWFTIGYNLVEGLISVALGLQDDSIALAGFGADSFIELGSALLVLWRFRGEVGQSESANLDRERQATLGIGILLLMLAVVTGAAAVYQIKAGGHPNTTTPGFIVSAISLSFMFYLWKAKQQLGKALDSSTVLKDADCSYACIKLSVVLLLGSAAYVLVPALWWADSVAAFLLSILIGREGWETVRATKDRNFKGGCGCAS